MKYEPTIRYRLLRATRHARPRRVSGEYCSVSARKIGLPASGSTIGKSALTTRNKTLTASATGFSAGSPVLHDFRRVSRVSGNRSAALSRPELLTCGLFRLITSRRDKNRLCASRGHFSKLRTAAHKGLRYKNHHQR